MISTLISLIIALSLFFGVNHPEKEAALLTNLFPLFVAAGSLFLIIHVLLIGSFLIPLQKAERNGPRLLNLYKADSQIIWSHIWFALFALFSFLMPVIQPLFSSTTDKTLLCLWIIFFGLSLDLMRRFYKLSLNYLDPFSLITRYSKAAKKSITTEKDLELCEWIDALSELSSNAIDRHTISLCNEAINEMEKIVATFMDSCKSISHISPTAQETPKQTNSEQALGKDADEVSYILFYVMQRLEFIYDKALKHGLEPICSAMISVLGKMAISAAKFDLSLTVEPIHFIGKFANRAQEQGYERIGDKATFTLIEIARTILTEIDFTYMEIQTPFKAIIGQMDEIAKFAFKRNKSLKIPILTQPFFDLKEMFKAEKAAAHQDASTINSQLDRVLGEFAALDAVLKTMPPLNLEG